MYNFVYFQKILYKYLNQYFSIKISTETIKLTQTFVFWIQITVCIETFLIVC